MRRGVGVREITGLVWTHFKGVRGLEGGGSDLKAGICASGVTTLTMKEQIWEQIKDRATGASFDGK